MLPRWLTLTSRFALGLLLLWTTYYFTLSSYPTLHHDLKSIADSILVDAIYSTGHSQNAYVQYATNRQYLCNALINAHRLRKFNVNAQIAVLVPPTFVDAPTNPIARLMDSLKELNVKVHTMDMTSRDLHRDDVTYRDSLHKLEILHLPYERIVYFDSDGLVMSSLDHLFTAPDADMLLPEAYYVPNTERVLSSAIMVVKPGEELFQHAIALARNATSSDYDMEIINQLAMSEEYKRSTGILPWKRYLILTGIFRDPTSYFYTTAKPVRSENEILSVTEFNEHGTWSARKVYDEAYYIHFSDWPIPKPWVDDKGVQVGMHGPKCRDPLLDPAKKADGDCEEVQVWREIYRAFRDEMSVCPVGDA